MTASSQSFGRQKKNILAEVHSGPQKTDLELLLTHVVLYLNRVFYADKFTDSQIADHELFSYRRYPISTELAFELDFRLNLLANYNLRKPNRILEILMSGIPAQVPMKLDRMQVHYLQQKVQKPTIGTMTLAKVLSTSSRKVNRVTSRLFSEYGIRTGAVLNPQKFGLKHFGVAFRGKSSEATQRFSYWLHHELKFGRTLPFLTGIGIDINGVEGFFSVFVPDQVQCLKQFQHTLKLLKEIILEDFEIHCIQGFFTHMNFDFFDYVTQQWTLSPDLLTEGVLRFVDQHGVQFSPLRGFTYDGSVISFQQPDWLLAITRCEGLLTKTEQQELLQCYGFNLAKKTIWTHLQQLQQQETYFPYIVFGRLVFSDIICLLIESDQAILEILHQLFAQYPSTHLFPTDLGAIVLLGIPSGSPSLIKQLTHTLLTIPRIQQRTVLRFKRHLPLLPSLKRYELWNAQTSLWEVQPQVIREDTFSA